MTISICLKVCSERSLPVFGLEHGRYCYCGRHESVFETHGVAPDYECNIPCAGAQLCGGNNFIVFYKNDVFRGCYAFPSNDLNLFGGYVPTLTLDVCQIKCGNSYSGLTQGNKCYCSDELPREATYGSASDCARNSLYCRGSEKCGGSGHTAIWINEETQSKSGNI
ncbi:hypothetical protein HOLleu_23080 [Holothuria leucospilota]|uniref:WSC domain-containing protein n=1 Tax=Holothuria leucospilota TaxID=206669 RepID=A0A9Q1BUM6_HOLLE|nr:hypothetical protein HOLleu_23080 [Holothuria leucospilota]